ncbi:MAG TPA: hypothetical protein VGK93_06980 [Candidatus Eisenbacteria bacterium]|jgi:hypothetical protein
MFAKRFFYVCAGLLCLALAYHLGARSATAQATKTQIATATGGSSCLVILANGDVYRDASGDGTRWVKAVNVFTP